MDTKAVTKMTAVFYEPWDQVMHVTNFTKQLTKQKIYLQIPGINISDKSKLQYYTEQMIDSNMFNKQDIMNWEDRIKLKCLQKLVASKEKYASVVGGTANKARFESAARMDERNNNKIRSNDRMCKYLGSGTAAATANAECMQEMTNTNK